MNRDDSYYMRKALRLAQKGAGKTSPNPMVGAVIVLHGKEVGAGFHHGPGLPHAEVMALSNAGCAVHGGTLYTNLEPCCHTEKRTPPCTETIIKSGITRVVAAMEDPNPKVCGRGFKRLSDAGIAVTTGVLQSAAMQLNESFVKYITTQKPFVILKAAMTLDGRIATPTGESKWITGEKARSEVHRLRSHVDAVLVGIGTVLADDPGLLANCAHFKNPLRIVIDPALDIPLSSQLVTSLKKAPTLICTLLPKSSQKAQQLQQQGVEVLSLPGENGEIPWNPLLETLGTRNITSLLIEGGGKINGRVLRAGIVDKVIFYIAPRFLCGNDAKAVVDGAAFRTLADAIQINRMSVRHVGEDLCIEGYPLAGRGH